MSSGTENSSATESDASSRSGVARSTGFWIAGLAVLTVLAASAAPTPLYPVYADTFDLGPATITAVFAVYAVALLAALLTLGGLSDHLGRRPVMLAALVVETISLLLFVVADGAGDLLLARVVQGIATGVFTGVASAALVDLEPEGTNGGALVNSAGALVGLAIGSMGCGLLIELAPAPLRLVYALLVVAMLALMVFVWRLPETSVRRPGAWASLKPEIGVPEAARGQFLIVLPILLATWSMGGLFLSLGPSIGRDVLDLGSSIAQGFLVMVFVGSGAIASIAVRSWPARRIMLVGSTVLAVGTALAVVGVATARAAVFLPAESVAGAGFGMAFFGAFQTLTALSEPARRAELLAAVFTVNYLSFAIPAVIAGLLVAQVGLAPVAEVYGLVVVALAILLVVLETIAGRRRERRSATS